MRKRDKRALAQEKQKQRNRTPEDQGHIDKLLDAIRKKWLQASGEESTP